MGEWEKVQHKPPAMPHDFEFEKGTLFGEWLHEQMREAMHFEDEAWAIDRVRRVENRLQAGREAGHRLVVAGWALKITRLPGASLFAFAFHALEHHLYGPQKECDADRHALDLCVAARYDAQKCLELFDILEQYALDMEDYDMVYGPDMESDDELDENASWKTKAQIWAWQRRRGYLPIRDRRQMVLKHLQKRLQENQPSSG